MPSEQILPLKDACRIVLGGVGACSPERYRDALERIAVLSGRTVGDGFRAEVTEILRAFPCPLD